MMQFLLSEDYYAITKIKLNNEYLLLDFGVAYVHFLPKMASKLDHIQDPGTALNKATNVDIYSPQRTL